MIFYPSDFLIILVAFSGKEKNIAFFTMFNRPFDRFIAVGFVIIRNAAFFHCRKSILRNFLNRFVAGVIACQNHKIGFCRNGIHHFRALCFIAVSGAAEKGYNPSLGTFLDGIQNFFKGIGSVGKISDNGEIAFMDNLIMATAVAELVTFPSIPVKVTLDEYIEIAKYYSTHGSSTFINGILDKIVASFTEEGKINKSGRGLI